MLSAIFCPMTYTFMYYLQRMDKLRLCFIALCGRKLSNIAYDDNQFIYVAGGTQISVVCPLLILVFLYRNDTC
jgi:hypothetical protein